MEYELVTSPSQGTVEEVTVKKNSRVLEGQLLFVIKDENEKMHDVKIGIDGEIYSLEVQEGDLVVKGMVLAYVKEGSYIENTNDLYHR